MNDRLERHPGGCLCGAVRYEARGGPLWVAHCHCRSCRRHTGTAMTSFVGFEAKGFAFTEGAPVTYASSPGVERQHCPDCGSALTYAATRFPGEVHVYLATLDRPDDYRPTAHVFYGEALPWLDIADDLPRYETTSGGVLSQDGGGA